uniref:Activin_recp domain-containing protein n=1 Tax=Steinernema glaseri TaxID=37863 RepID=A0A1I8AIM9_9BILA
MQGCCLLVQIETAQTAHLSCLSRARLALSAFSKDAGNMTITAHMCGNPSICNEKTEDLSRKIVCCPSDLCNENVKKAQSTTPSPIVILSSVVSVFCALLFQPPNKTGLISRP